MATQCILIGEISPTNMANPVLYMNSLMNGKFNLVIKLLATQGTFHFVSMHSLMLLQSVHAVEGFATLLTDGDLMFSFEVFF